jgi:hypothetical protein
MEKENLFEKQLTLVVPALCHVKKATENLNYQTQKRGKIIVHPSTDDLLNENDNFIFVKPYSITELATLYGVSKKTFKKWLKPFENEIGERNGRYYTVRQVRVIFDRLDFPHYLEVA